MKKFFLFFFFSFILLISNKSFAELAKGKWIFVKDDDYCYIGSLPTLFDVPEGKEITLSLFLFLFLFFIF